MQAAGATGTTVAPGDVVNGGAGTDTLSIAVAGNAGAAYTLSAIQTNAVEKVLLNNFDTDGTNATTVDTALMNGVTTVGLSASSAEGDTTFSNMTAIVGAEMRNGAADLTLTYGTAAVAGTADTQALTVSNVSAGTFTADGAETIAVTTELVKSTLTNVASNSLKTVTVAGAADLTIGTALTATTINAAAMTGALNVKLGTADQAVTGGAGADVIDAATSLSSADTIVGGAGTDTLKVSISAATAVGTAASKGALYGVSGVEVLDVASTNDAAAVDLDNTAGIATVSAAANVKTVTFTGDTANTAAEAIAFTLNGVARTTASVSFTSTTAATDAGLAATALATTINAVAGFTATANAAVVTVTSTTGEAVELAITAGSAATFTEVTSAYGDVSFTNITNQAVDIYSADAVTASLKDASGTADSLSINLKTLSADKGFNQTIGTVTANLIETINLSSTGMTDGKVKTVSSLAASGIKTLNITGESDLTISGFGTQVAAIDGSAASGDLNLTVSTKDQSIKTGSGNDTIIMAGTLTAADTIDGGANNAIAGGTTVGKDLLTATGNIGTVTTPAALKIANVETIEVTNTGAAATYIDAAGITGAEGINFSAASGTVKMTNLAAGTKIGLSITTDEFDGTMDLALADATGTNDSISLFYAKEADTASTVAVKVAGVETLNIAATTESVGADTFTITSTDLASKNIVVTGGHSADTLALGTLNAATTNVDASAYAGILTATTAATGAVTASAKGGLLHNLVTGAGADTITLVGANGTAAVTINGNAGTDVLNINLDNAASDFTNVSNIETINITVSGNKQAGFTDGTADDGLNAATTVNILGGDALSTFTVGTNDVLDDDTLGTATLKLDASAFGGAIDIAAASDAFDAELSILGGAILTDKVTAIIAGVDNKVALMSGVETLVLKSTDNDVAASADLTNVTGLVTLDAQFVTVTNDDQIKVDKLAAGVKVKTTVTSTGDNLVLNLATVTGTTDSIDLELTEFSDTGGTTEVLNLDAAGIETLNLNLKNANAGKLDLAGVTATTGSTVTVNLSGTGVADISALSASTNTVVSTGTGALTVGAAARAATAMTITGGEGADSIAMENAADVLTGGLGTDSLVVSFAAILGGIEVNLGATDQVVSINGSANSAVQSGFENVDVSAFTGFGAVVSGSTGANTIVGTALADQITGGNGADSITAGGGNDTIDLTETTSAVDTVVFAATAAANGVDTITGFELTDILNWVQGDAETDGATAFTTNANDLYRLGAQAAGDADSAAAVAAAFNTAATVTAAAATAWIVISDNDSTSIWAWVDVAGVADEVNVAEITLVGTIATAMTSAQLATAFTIV